MIGSTQQYYELQEADPEFARHFRVKVDFAESFPVNPQTYAASAVFVAYACQKLGLPHFSSNRRHLMLDAQVVDAVARGLFHIYSTEHVSDGMALLTGVASGLDAAMTTLPPRGLRP